AGATTREIVYPCRVCGKIYSRKSSMYTHVRLCVRSQKKLWPCSQCGKRYKWRASLKTHIRVECGKEPTFTCPICGKKFKHKHRWQSHAKSIHLVSKKVWWCSQCGKRYMWRDSLKKHLRVECGKDPTFECPICGRKFKHKHRWQSHAKLIHYVTM
ncbi:unnamed protein product, partial [Heterotrigona itama]